MKELIVGPGLTSKIVEHEIPEPGPDQIVVKVAAAGINPKDWKMPVLWEISVNTGDDVAGLVHAVGSNVVDFHLGDRVAGLHAPGTPNGAFAEYAVVEACTAWILGPETTFEEGSILPLNFCTAAAGLYLNLGLPEPWHPAKLTTPLIIWGAASAVGAYAVQLAMESNIHPLICIAGSSKQYVETLIDRTKGDTVLDYRDSEENIKKGIRDAAGSCEISYAFEAVSTERSAHIMADTLKADGKVALVQYEKEYVDIPSHVNASKYNVMVLHKEEQNFGFVLSRFVGRGLQKGWFKPLKHEIVPGGLRGVLTALERLKEGKNHAIKYVIQL